MNNTRNKKVQTSKKKMSGSKTNKTTPVKKTTQNTSNKKSVTKSSKPRYTRDDRVHIKRQIENLSSEEEYNAVFDILNDDPNNSYSCNENGLFLDMAALTDETLTKISKYLRVLNKKKKKQIEEDVQSDIIPGLSSETNTRTYKLSNYEKNIIKQRNLKKILNQDTEYQELKVNS